MGWNFETVWISSSSTAFLSGMRKSLTLSLFKNDRKQRESFIKAVKRSNEDCMLQSQEWWEAEQRRKEEKHWRSAKADCGAEWAPGNAQPSPTSMLRRSTRRWILQNPKTIKYGGICYCVTYSPWIFCWVLVISYLWLNEMK